MTPGAVQQVAINAEKAGATLATGGGMWLWLAENQQAIAALGVLVGMFVGVAGFAVHWWYLHRGNQTKQGRRKSDGDGA